MTQFEVDYERRWRDIALFSFGAVAGIVLSIISLAILMPTLG